MPRGCARVYSLCREVDSPPAQAEFPQCVQIARTSSEGEMHLHLYTYMIIGYLIRGAHSWGRLILSPQSLIVYSSSFRGEAL